MYFVQKRFILLVLYCILKIFHYPKWHMFGQKLEMENNFFNFNPSQSRISAFWSLGLWRTRRRRVLSQTFWLATGKLWLAGRIRDSIVLSQLPFLPAASYFHPSPAPAWSLKGSSRLAVLLWEVGACCQGVVRIQGLLANTCEKFVVRIGSLLKCVIKVKDLLANASETK